MSVIVMEGGEVGAVTICGTRWLTAGRDADQGCDGQ